MSPLVRSLLALAALLSAADAELPDPCGRLLIGEKTDERIEYSRIVTNGRVVIRDKCSLPGRMAAGLHVIACNEEYPPRITEIRRRSVHPNFYEVKVHCPRRYVGCRRLELSVTQYCKMGGIPPLIDA